MMFTLSLSAIKNWIKWPLLLAKNNNLKNLPKLRWLILSQQSLEFVHDRRAHIEKSRDLFLRPIILSDQTHLNKSFRSSSLNQTFFLSRSTRSRMLSRVILAAVVCVAALAAVGSATPLDDYVNRPDPTYKYEVLQTLKLTNYTLYIINMTSQTWLDSKNPVSIENQVCR